MSHYMSPFRAMNPGHESDNPACLSAWEEPNTRTFTEFHNAAQALLASDTADVGQVVFGLVRHLAELALKLRIHGVTQPWEPGHDLEALVGGLPVEDPVRSPDPEDQNQVQLAGFIQELHRIDPEGDAWRYGHHLKGGECLDDWCCIEKTDLAHHASLVFEYGMAAVGSSTVRAC